MEAYFYVFEWKYDENSVPYSKANKAIDVVFAENLDYTLFYTNMGKYNII